MANSLKATPSVGNSFISVQPLLPSPIREEVELCVKEMKVGSTLDQALLNLGGRINSRQLDTALSAILIGRQLGGDLPRILDTTANTMREMIRLEGVVKSKTAEGKAQLWVLASFPFVFAVVLSTMEPGFYDPLKKPVAGWAIARRGRTLVARLDLARAQGPVGGHMRISYLEIRYVVVAAIGVSRGLRVYAVASAPSRVASRLGMRGSQASARDSRRTSSGAQIEPFVRWFGVRVSGL